jgi:myo-inositol-1-phosphate synthase
MELARENHVPIAGKDFKTGQTLMKTILAPGFKARMLGLAGWYSTNILGNRDGEVLDDPESFKSKEVTKLGVIDRSSSRRSTRRCTGTSRTSSASTTTRRAATTRRAGTTSTSSGGWATRCRSRSTSCAATRSSRRRSSTTSCCSWTSPAGRPARHPGVAVVLLEEPAGADRRVPEHDLFIQLMKLKNTLRWTKGDDLITHLGAEYYD